jgi:hypothetical protein
MTERLFEAATVGQTAENRWRAAKETCTQNSQIQALPAPHHQAAVDVQNGGSRISKLKFWLRSVAGAPVRVRA